MQRKTHEPRRPNIDLSGRIPAHQLGQISIDGTPTQLLDFGAWDGSVNYVQGNLVNDSGVTYLCVNGNSGDEPPSSNWQVFDPTAYYLRSDRIWSPVGGVYGYYADTAESLSSPGEAYMTFNGNFGGGTDLFSYGDGDAFPSPIAAGVYALTVNVEVTSISGGGDPTKFFEGILEKYNDSQYLSVQNMSPLISESPNTLPNLSLTAIWPLTPDNFLRMRVQQTLASTVDYTMIVLAVKLS